MTVLFLKYFKSSMYRSFHTIIYTPVNKDMYGTVALARMTVLFLKYFKSSMYSTIHTSLHTLVNNDVNGTVALAGMTVLFWKYFLSIIFQGRSGFIHIPRMYSTPILIKINTAMELCLSLD